MTKYKKTVFLAIVIFVIIIVSVIFALFYKTAPIRPSQNFSSNQTVSTSTGSQIISALFTCGGGKTIQASFYNDSNSFVDLTLSDGRTMRVPQAISASGARYATENESFVFWNKGNTAFIEENGTTTFMDCLTDNSTPGFTINATTTLANPASVNCEQQGGQLQMATRPDGGQYGLCYFDDNRACEEWAMMRGECPVGGMKTTGYDTDAQKFCAWSGGQTIAAPNAICTFKDGSTCPDDAFYNGTCQPSGNIK